NAFRYAGLLRFCRPGRYRLLAIGLAEAECVSVGRKLCVLRLVGLALPAPDGRVDYHRLYYRSKDRGCFRSGRTQEVADSIFVRQLRDSGLLQVLWLLH